MEKVEELAYDTIMEYEERKRKKQFIQPENKSVE